MKTIWDECGQLYQYTEFKDLKFIVDEVIKNCDSVFEGACGTGILPTMLRKYGFKGDYLGSDYVDNFLSHAKANNPNEKFIQIDLLKPIPLADNSFDAFVVRHGMEHIYPYENTLREMKRIAQKKIILSFWVDFINRNFIKDQNFDVNHYDKKEYYDTIKKAGLEIIDDRYIMNENKVNNHILILI